MRPAAPGAAEPEGMRDGSARQTAPQAYPTALTEAAVLLKGRGGGVGAILFAVPGAGAATVAPELALPTLEDIPALFRAILDLEAGIQVDEDLRAMLMSSWDMGGARPKAVVRDEAGEAWIVKFPRRIDTFSRQRVEWANLEMARAIGMNVPDTALVELQGGDCALRPKASSSACSPFSPSAIGTTWTLA